MAHIALPDNMAGIIGLLNTYPETGGPLCELAQSLLRGPSSLTEGERELIAAFVSSRNGCTYCMSTHGAAAKYFLKDDNGKILKDVFDDYNAADVSKKMKALLKIASQVQEGGKQVSNEAIKAARDEGADDKAIHDTVLIAAAFCMFNRYVDGLATWQPEDASVYEKRGALLAEKGYVR